jgi:hypothetical protein
LNAHKNNYGDIVWWDMLFGTYENPSEFRSSCGFDDAKEQQLLAMLQLRDVHKDPSYLPIIDPPMAVSDSRDISIGAAAAIEYELLLIREFPLARFASASVTVITICRDACHCPHTLTVL